MGNVLGCKQSPSLHTGALKRENECQICEKIATEQYFPEVLQIDIMLYSVILNFESGTARLCCEHVSCALQSGSIFDFETIPHYGETTQMRAADLNFLMVPLRVVSQLTINKLTAVFHGLYLTIRL